MEVAQELAVVVVEFAACLRALVEVAFEDAFQPPVATC